MTRIFIIILFTFCVGCAKQPPKPMYIEVKPNGIIRIGTDIYDNARLIELLRNKIRNEGANIPIYFIAGKDTPFSRVKGVILTVADTGGYELHFQIKGVAKEERCDHDWVISDGPKITKVNAEIKNEVLYINSNKTSINEFKELIRLKPVDTYGYRVLISCSDDSRFCVVYEVIEASCQSENARPEIAIKDEIVKKYNLK
ncbi:MAG: hypothetical protein WAX69_01390 [Victivallales bacterium]